MSEFDLVQKAKHYESHESGISCKELLDFLNCNVGLALKYVWRYQDKGTPLQDLQKARWYLNRHLHNPWAPVFVYDPSPVPWFAQKTEEYISGSQTRFERLACQVVYKGAARREGLLADFLVSLKEGKVAQALDHVNAMIAALEP